MKWISIDKELPQVGQGVLVFQIWPKGTMFNCLHYPLCRCDYSVAEYAGGSRFYEKGTSMNFVKYVTHWMQLPLQPEEDL